MEYKKGQILTYDFPPRVIEEIKSNKVMKNYNKSNVISDYHRVVVLHTRKTPYRTVLVAPITSAEGLKSKESIPQNYVELKKEDYPFVLKNDSYINLDMTMPVDEDELNFLERYEKKINKMITKDDMYQMDFKIYLTYELKSYFEDNLREEFSTVIQYIDEDVREKVNAIIEKIKNPEISELLQDIIDNDLIGVLKSSYLDRKDKK